MIGLAAAAFGQTVVLEGEVPDDGLDHFFLPFQVPEGILELEVRHDDLSDDDILDWGLYDPAGQRGWGGGNPEPVVINAAAASRSYLPGPIVPGTWQVVVGKAKIAAPPGAYRVEVELRREITLPAQPERRPYADVPALEPTARWYAGDLHVHSRESGDATATLDEIADLARERGLDFVVVTDHNTVSHLDWLADAQARHPDVLLIPGTEFTTYAGHANAFGVRGWVDHKLGQPGVTIDAAAEAYAVQGALLSINHPVLDLGGFCIGCAWDLPVPAEQLAAIEIATGGWEPVGQAFTPGAIALWDGLCAEGHRLAAVGGSDDHRAGTDTGPTASPIGNPTTLVWASALSAGAILDGIAAGRTVVKLQGPEDPMVALTPRLGQVVAHVTGGAGTELVWVADGVEVERVPVVGDAFEHARDPGDAERVRAELWSGDRPRTVTSHLWADELPPVDAPPAASGCGCTTRGAVIPRNPGWALVPALVAVRRRRTTRS